MKGLILGWYHRAKDWQGMMKNEIKPDARETEARQALRPPTEGPRFAFLHHVEVPEPHWDLLLEIPDQEKLATWRVHTTPEDVGRSGVKLSCTRIGDHRRMYLDYEGPISGGRGMVRRVAAGTWTLLHQNACAWQVQLQSKGLNVVLVLPAQEIPAK